MWKCIVVLTMFMMGCTPTDYGRLKGVTADDALLYVEENHARRQQIRALQDELRSKAVNAYIFQATTEARAGNWEKAIEHWSAADKILTQGYPSLATIELLKEGAEDFNELKGIFNEDR